MITKGKSLEAVRHTTRSADQAWMGSTWRSTKVRTFLPTPIVRLNPSSSHAFSSCRTQGKWYEQKFHDWTQFKEVYDTTLDIRLTSDKKVIAMMLKSIISHWDVRILLISYFACCRRAGLTTSESRDRRRTRLNCLGINRPLPTELITL
jgi:hypothetical protein